MRSLPGVLALGVLIGVIAVAFAGLLLAAEPSRSAVPWAYLRGLVAFSLGQAALSTVLSLSLGAALALALARRVRATGRGLFIAAMNLATVLPAIVLVFGLVAVYGRSGWLGQAANWFGLDLGSWLYGLPGILIAHVFFNAPIAARVFLAALSSVPAEHWRLAAHLGMQPSAVLRIIDRPILAREALGVAGLIFALCFTSFAIVLALGGGPRAATLEVAIYEAIRFDVDFGRAGLIAAMQVGICLAVILPFVRLRGLGHEIAAVGLTYDRPDIGHRSTMIADAIALCAGALLILPPLMAVATSGAGAWARLSAPDLFGALATSLAVAVPAGLLAVALALGLASLIRYLRLTAQQPYAADAVGLAALVVLIVPPFAITAGLFVVLRRVADPFALALPLVALVNALLALPFALRQLEPPLVAAGERYGRLADSLGIDGWHRIRLVDWPLLRRPLMVALAVAMALSLGDFGVAALFGSGDLVTLPVLLYDLMSAYRMEEAASVSLLIALLVLGLFLVAQRLSGDSLARNR